VVTAWSEHYELFAATEPLVAGQEARSDVHLTWLQEFSAVSEGSVTGILQGEDGREESFLAPKQLRTGIFRLTFKPSREGTYDLVFRVRAKGRTEDIPSGRVRVGTGASPGGLVEPPPGTPDGEAAAGEPIGFSKEQQWRTPFGTAWAANGRLGKSLRAPARVVPAAGGEVILTSPVDGVVTASRWPHAGLTVGKGSPLFTLIPRGAVDRSLSVPESSHMRAPIAGRIMEITVRPGQLVKAGAPLGRIVSTSPVWLELALRPEQAGAFSEAPTGLHLRRGAGEEPLPIPGEDVRLVSRSPKADPGTGTVAVILEVRRSVDLLRIGSHVNAEVSLPGEKAGIVIPATALVDDGGAEVVYVQLGGESFERREVAIEARQGPLVLVRGIAPGERIVTRGGSAIRRRRRPGRRCPA
jgi:multidrug efflux pump subunit AcrA (membrane-fusion protein)